MKIKRYQQGGVYYTPVFRDPVTPAARKTAEPTEDKGEQLIKKEIVSALNENGLPNDVDYFLSKANSFLVSSQNLNPFLSGIGTGTSGSYDMGDLIKIQSLANKIRHNKELYTKASEQITKEGAGSEVALTNDGRLYVYDKDGNIKTVTADIYHKSDKYQALTTTQLMQIRAERPDMVYNSSILTDMNNTIGMKSIVDYMKATISSFGTNKSSSSRDIYVGKNQGKIQKGFEQLLGVDTPDGIYKVGQAQSISNQGYGDSESLEAAINYLYKTLNQNMKNVIRAQVAAEGKDPTDVNNVKAFLQAAIQEHTNHSIEEKQNLSYESTLSKDKSGTGTGSKDSTSKVALPFGVSVERNMGEVRSNGMVLPGGNVKFNLPTYWYDLRTLDNKATKGLMTATDVYQTLRDHGIIDITGTITFGGIPLEQITAQGGDIIVDNTKGMGVAYLPVDERGNIDHTMFRIMTAIQERIIKDRVTDEAELKRIWEENEFQYDPVRKIGVPPNQTLKKFAMLSAYTSTKGPLKSKVLKEDQLLQEVNNDVYNDLVNSYNLDPDNKRKLNDIWRFRDAYQGFLFIPLNSNENSSNIAGGIAYTAKPDADYVKARQDAARQAGAYDPNTGTYNHTVNGMTINGVTTNSLD